MQPGPDAIGIIAISHGCVGIAARACGLVALDASKVSEILKDRPGWSQDCRRMEVLGALSTGNGGTIELLYTQVNELVFLFVMLLLDCRHLLTEPFNTFKSGKSELFYIVICSEACLLT